MSFGYRTDHSFIGVDINIKDTNRGKCFWKFNTSLLKDKHVDMVKAGIKKTVSIVQVIMIQSLLASTLIVARVTLEDIHMMDFQILSHFYCTLTVMLLRTFYKLFYLHVNKLVV